MEMRHKVSIIVPCYNCAGFINKCLSSLEQQTYKDFDLILVNDCSTDDTESVIREYAAKTSIFVIIISNSKNIGPALTRKRGLEKANSEFICFCDSDDWYDPSFLADFVEQQYIKNADIVFCGHKLVYEDGRVLERPLALSVSDLSNIKQILVKSNDSLCMLMIRTDLIKNLVFPDLRNGEDMALIPMLITKSRRFAVVNKCNYNYYCRPVSSSQNASFEQINSLKKSFSYIESYLYESYYYETEYLGIRNFLYGALINVFKFTSDVNLAKGIIFEFEKKYPTWRKNKYIKNLSFPKRLFLNLTSLRLYILMRLMSKMHKYLNH